MLRKKTSKTKTVSDKISELLERNTHGKDESSDEQSEEPRVEEEFDEYDLPDTRSSDIRKRNVKLLSEHSARYRGKISSRNELEQEQESDLSDEEEQSEEDDDDSSDDDNEVDLKAFTKKLNGASSKRRDAPPVEDESEEDESADSDLNDDNEYHDSEVDITAFTKKLNGASSKRRDVPPVEEDASAESDLNEDNDVEEDEEEGDDQEDYDGDGIESEDDDTDQENAEGTDIITETNRQAEVQKGQCVQNQLQIWERLLEMRIHTQKVISKSNQLRPIDDLKVQQSENEKLADVSRESVNRVSTLLSTLLQLQNALCEQFSEQRSALKKTLKRPLPIHEPETDNHIPIKRFADHIDTHFQDFKPYRNAVLLKWDDRTKLLTPGAGAKKKSLTENYDIVRKIENALQNRTLLVEKSQTMKNEVDGIEDNGTAENGDSENAQRHNRNVELYDDSDFYHQQLRELIEYKTNTSVSASEVTQQYVELQKLRQKMKKKVDTRASKGRKLRYTVHNKLINFMAPDDTSTWTEESKDELYRSLFAA